MSTNKIVINGEDFILVDKRTALKAFAMLVGVIGDLGPLFVDGDEARALMTDETPKGDKPEKAEGKPKKVRNYRAEWKRRKANLTGVAPAAKAQTARGKKPARINCLHCGKSINRMGTCRRYCTVTCRNRHNSARYAARLKAKGVKRMSQAVEPTVSVGAVDVNKLFE